jgi:hypothetical protein
MKPDFSSAKWSKDGGKLTLSTDSTQIWRRFRAQVTRTPTIRRVAVIDAIKDCSKRKGIILDAFGGSGTTLIAAEKTGRRACLLELDALYVDVTIRRWQQLSKKAARHAATGLTFEETAARRQGASEVRHV